MPFSNPFRRAKKNPERISSSEQQNHQATGYSQDKVESPAPKPELVFHAQVIYCLEIILKQTFMCMLSIIAA